MRLLSCLFAAALLLAGCANGGLTPQGARILNTAVADGQLFCATTAAAGPAILAIVSAIDAKAVTVTNQTAGYVAQACKLVNGIPVVPPADPAAVPAVAIVPPPTTIAPAV